jgi:hypothetical protein
VIERSSTSARTMRMAAGWSWNIAVTLKVDAPEPGLA